MLLVLSALGEHQGYEVGDCADAGSATLIRAAFARTNERISKRIGISPL
jgi:hypothetical protein